MSHPDKLMATQGLYTAAIRQSVVKLDPRSLWRNPVMFVTAVVAAMTTVLGLRDLLGGAPGAGTALHISAWLWLCVLFANFAEALAEGRGRARADTLRATKSESSIFPVNTDLWNFVRLTKNASKAHGAPLPQKL